MKKSSKPCSCGTRTAGVPGFRILALGGAPDWSLVKTCADLDNWQVRRAVFHGETEKDWASLVIDSVLARNQKMLVDCGTHHDFTKYAQPIVSDGKLLRTEDTRFGQYLLTHAPTRIFMIALHFRWPGVTDYSAPSVLPADGMLDKVMGAAGERWRGAR